MKNYPLAILSFNRPEYLGPVLDSLAAQTALNDRAVCLFQDNAVSPYSQQRYGSDEDIQACIDLFRAKFPQGQVFLSEHNTGVCRNYKRAEDHVFTTLGADVAYFFEDDMVVSPHYLTMMDRISDFALTSGKVGYFAAYGKHRLRLPQQRDQAKGMHRLALHWAFGITRHHWAELREWLKPYYEFSEGRDYKKRPTTAIAAYYRERGWPVDVTTQDHTKKVGTYVLGRACINTLAVFGKYIGQTGLHMNPDLYNRKKYARTEFYPEPVGLDFPSPADIERFRVEEIERRWNSVHAKVARKEAEKRGVELGDAVDAEDADMD